MIQCIPQKTWPAVPPTPSETLTQPSAELPLLPSAEPPTLSACTTIPQAVAVCGCGLRLWEARRKFVLKMG